jgi:hypothetical protein
MPPCYSKCEHLSPAENYNFSLLRINNINLISATKNFLAELKQLLTFPPLRRLPDNNPSRARWRLRLDPR